MKNLTTIGGIAVVVAYAIGSGLWVNTGDGCRSLNQTAWQPPQPLRTYLGFPVLSPTQFKPCIRGTCSNSSIS
jgi:hypothetical protein